MLDQLEPVEQDTATYRPRQALGYWPLLLALWVSFTLGLAQWWRNGPVLFPSTARNIKSDPGDSRGVNGAPPQ